MDSLDERSPQHVLLRLGVLILIVCTGALAVAHVDLPPIAMMRTWVEENGPVASLVLVAGQAIALMTPAPRSVLSTAVGAVAGFTVGLPLVLVGGMLGAVGGYAVSRWTGQAAVLHATSPRLDRLHEALLRREFIAVVTARLMPMLPFVLVSYAAGLSRVRWAPYTLGTAIGLVPGSVLYVGVGASVTLIGSATTLLPLLLTFAALAVAGMTWMLKRRRGWSRSAGLVGVDS